MVTTIRIMQIHLSRGESVEEGKIVLTKTPLGKFSANSVQKMLFDSTGATSNLNDGIHRTFWLKLWKDK